MKPADHHVSSLIEISLRCDEYRKMLDAVAAGKLTKDEVWARLRQIDHELDEQPG